MAQPACAMSGGPSSRAAAVPVGMKVPQKPIALLRRVGSTRVRSKAGPGTMTMRIAAPSIARMTSSCEALVVRPVSKLSDPSKVRPVSKLRRRPMPSATIPMSTAVSMPAICERDSNHPACTNVRPSWACSTGMAGATLPTCMAATIPAATTNAAGRPDVGCAW